MNLFMNDVALATFSNFDTGKHSSARTQPERFYHGFVLGLLVELRGRYSVQSNKESGYGRYDICLIPQKTTDPAIVLEFKVHDPDEEKNASRDCGISVKADRRKKLMIQCLSSKESAKNKYDTMVLLLRERKC